MSPSALEGNSTARAVFLARALGDLDLLLGCADSWLSREEVRIMSAEAEPIVRALATCIQARVPAVVVPMLVDSDSRIDELVEFALEGVRKNLALIDHIAH